MASPDEQVIWTTLYRLNDSFNEARGENLGERLLPLLTQARTASNLQVVSRLSTQQALLIFETKATKEAIVYSMHADRLFPLISEGLHILKIEGTSTSRLSAFTGPLRASTMLALRGRFPLIIFSRWFLSGINLRPTRLCSLLTNPQSLLDRPVANLRTLALSATFIRKELNLLNGLLRTTSRSRASNASALENF